MYHMGPYAANDSGTGALKTWYIVPVPHPLAGLLLAYPDSLSPCQFWTDIFPVIDANGLTGSCQYLLPFFHIAIL